MIAAEQTPTFPVIWLGDECGVMHFANQESFFKTDLASWGPLTLDWGNLICSNGIEWSTSVSSQEKVTLGKRLKALLGRSVYTRVEYKYERTGELALDELKARLIKQSEKDPGDVMWQHTEHEAIVNGVTEAENVHDLFEYVRLSVCGEGDV